jgi:hypothetical protein
LEQVKSEECKVEGVTGLMRHGDLSIKQAGLEFPYHQAVYRPLTSAYRIDFLPSPSTFHFPPIFFSRPACVSADVHNSGAQFFGVNGKGVLYLQPASKKAAVLRKV